jgi:hypothetical protein
VNGGVRPVAFALRSFNEDIYHNLSLCVKDVTTSRQHEQTDFTFVTAEVDVSLGTCIDSALDRFLI